MDGPAFIEKIGPVHAPAKLASDWPLVHRTHRVHAPSLESIATSGKIEAQPAGSEAEVAVGRTPAAYLFAGAGAYPKGLVAFLFEPALTQALEATLTPFDTGGVGQKRFSFAGEPRALYEEWCTDGAALQEVMPHYVGHLFGDPLEYVRRSAGQPDRPAPHGVVSESGFRGAWTVEVQVQVDVPVMPFLRAVVFARRAIALRCPSAWLHKARRPPEKEPSEEEFAGAISEEILRTS